MLTMKRFIAVLAVVTLASVGCGQVDNPTAATLEPTMGTTGCEIYSPDTRESDLRVCSPREIQVGHTLLVGQR